MKNLLKGLGAAVGYIAIYIIVTILVVISGSIVYGIMVGFAAINSNQSLDSVTESLTSYINDSAMIYMLVAGVITLFIYWLIIIARKKTLKESLDLVPVSLHSLWPIIPFGIFFNLFISSFLPMLPIPEALIQDYAQSSSVLSGETTLEMILSVVIMAPLLEEVLFRGLVMKSLRRVMPLIPALILQSLGFGLLHGQIIWICYATVLGIVLGLIKSRYNSLYPCILFHLIFNGWNFVMEPIYDWLPDSGFITVALFLISTVIIVLLGILIFKKTLPQKMEQLDDLIEIT